jgi:hypothetical protein
VTSHEALVLGVVWGALARTVEADHGWTIEIPGYGPTCETAPAEIVLRTPSGVELLVTVTTRPAGPEGGS